MEVGKPRRVHRVEPLKEPVPAQPQQAPPAEQPPAAPKEVPAEVKVPAR
jgi:hypothetical protein